MLLDRSTDYRGIKVGLLTVCACDNKVAYIFRLQLATLTDLILISAQNSIGLQYIFSFERLLNV